MTALYWLAFLGGIAVGYLLGVAAVLVYLWRVRADL